MQEFVYTTAIDKLRKLSKRTKIIPGGTSAGKTFGIIPILINKAINNPRLEISIVAESIPNLRRGALKDFIKIMNKADVIVGHNADGFDQPWIRLIHLQMDHLLSSLGLICLIN